MSFIRNIFGPFPKWNSRPKKMSLNSDLIPKDWMPDAPMRAIVNHWTAGAHVASSLDREHYHFLVEGDKTVVKGHNDVSANIPPLRSGKYAAHTRRFNSYSIGLAVCAMAGATGWPLKFGKYPIKRGQWERLVMVNAILCERYNIPVTSKTVLMHGEVQENLGIQQNGKWDIGALTWWSKSKVDCAAIGYMLRRDIKRVMNK